MHTLFINFSLSFNFIFFSFPHKLIKTLDLIMVHKCLAALSKIENNFGLSSFSFSKWKLLWWVAERIWNHKIKEKWMDQIALTPYNRSDCFLATIPTNQIYEICVLSLCFSGLIKLKHITARDAPLFWSLTKDTGKPCGHAPK